MESQEPELINYRQLEMLIFLGSADFLGFLEDVCEDVPVYMERIREAILAGHPEEIKAGAHSMRGMLANFGCIGMASALHHLEYEMTPAPDEAAVICEGLDELWKKSFEAIKQWHLTVPEFAP